jgi:hypothetical protein
MMDGMLVLPFSCLLIFSDQMPNQARQHSVLRYGQQQAKQTHSPDTVQDFINLVRLEQMATRSELTVRLVGQGLVISRPSCQGLLAAQQLLKFFLMVYLIHKLL